MLVRMGETSLDALIDCVDTFDFVILVFFK